MEEACSQHQKKRGEKVVIEVDNRTKAFVESNGDSTAVGIIDQ